MVNGQVAIGQVAVGQVAAAGHASLVTTSVYLHVAVDNDGEIGSLFGFSKSSPDVK